MRENESGKGDEVHFYVLVFSRAGIADERSSQVLYIRIKAASDEDSQECCYSSDLYSSRQGTHCSPSPATEPLVCNGTMDLLAGASHKEEE